MALPRKLIIKESIDFLETLRRTSKSHRVKTRILFLLLKHEGKYTNQKDLSTFLDVSESSVRRWAKVYSESGLEEMLKISNGGKRREVVTGDIHDALKIKLNDSNNPFQGYTDAVLWVEHKFNRKIKYNTLRTYMIKQFGSKLKSPRKSHYKKDPDAEAFFKKPI
mgnify:CR=1 FL=1